MGKMKQTTGNNTSERVAAYIISLGTEELASLTEAKIADTLGMDLADLVQTFKSHQKITLDRFIVRQKMYRSLLLLDKNHKISIQELANKLGFPRIEPFAREFKNYLLIEPQVYKDLIHGNK